MIFQYKAATNQGTQRVGEVSAVSESEAVSILQKQGLVVLDITVKSAPSGIVGKAMPLVSGVKSKTLVVFARQLATLVSADVPIVESLESLAKQEDNKYFRGVINSIAADIGGGLPISKAFAKYPRVFDQFFVAMAQVGESTGTIAATFNYLADYLEKNDDIKSRVRGALMYPLVIIIAFTIIGVIMAIFVLPQITAMFEDSEQELPTLTKAIIAIANFSKEYWYLLILIIFGVPIAIVGLLFRTSSGKNFWDKYSLKIPVMGVLLKKIYLSRFAESMSTLIKGGLPMLETIKITASVMTNLVYKRILINMMSDVKTGKSMSASLEQYPEFFPVMVSQLVKVGESTGKTTLTLETASRFYKKEVERVVENLTTILEPLIIIMLGVAVGLLVVGVLYPIYQFSSTIS